MHTSRRVTSLTRIGGAVFGYCSAIISAWIWIPQIIYLYKTKEVGMLSLPMFVIQVCVCMWIDVRSVCGMMWGVCGFVHIHAYVWGICGHSIFYFCERYVDMLIQNVHLCVYMCIHHSTHLYGEHGAYYIDIRTYTHTHQHTTLFTHFLLYAQAPGGFAVVYFQGTALSFGFYYISSLY